MAVIKIVPEGERVEVTGTVADSVDQFLELIIHESIVFSNLGIASDMETEVRALRDTYIRI